MQKETDYKITAIPFRETTFSGVEIKVKRGLKSNSAVLLHYEEHKLRATVEMLKESVKQMSISTVAEYIMDTQLEISPTNGYLLYGEIKHLLIFHFHISVFEADDFLAASPPRGGVFNYQKCCDVIDDVYSRIC